MSEENILETFPYLKKKKNVNIKVIKIYDPKEVFKNPPVEHVDPWGPCPLFFEGQEIVVGRGGEMPDGFCASAWVTLWDKVRTLSMGGSFPYFKYRDDTIISCCSDGLRPVIFQLERIED